MHSRLRLRAAAIVVILSCVFCAALSVTSFAISLATPLDAQGTFLRNRPGKWIAPAAIPPRMAVELSAADRAGATAWSNQIVEMFHRMPTLAKPVGFDVAPSSFAELSSLDRGQDEIGLQYVSGTVSVEFPVYKQSEKGAVTDDRNVAATISIAVNDLSAVVQGGMESSGKPYADRAGRFFTSTAEPVDTLHGFPVYRVLNDQWVILRRNNVPFFVPVSRERFLRYNIGWAEANLADARQKLEKNKAGLANLPRGAAMMRDANEALAKEQASLDEAKKTVAAMTQQQRISPAFINESDTAGIMPRLLDANSDNANAVVAVNPALMDANLPRSTPQIIAVRITTDDPNWPELAERLDSEIDWAFLAQLVHATP